MYEIFQVLPWCTISYSLISNPIHHSTIYINNTLLELLFIHEYKTALQSLPIIQTRHDIFMPCEIIVTEECDGNFLTTLTKTMQALC